MESRLTEFEIRQALQDDQLDELNRTVAKQQQQINQLQDDLRTLCQYLQTLEPAGRSAPAHEIPPHY